MERVSFVEGRRVERVRENAVGLRVSVQTAEASSVGCYRLAKAEILSMLLLLLGNFAGR